MKFIYENTHPSKIPSGFTEIEYLQSDGNQYITTDLIPNSNYGVEVRYVSTALPTSASEKNQAVFGARSSFSGDWAFAMWFGPTAGIYPQFANVMDNVASYVQLINIDYTYTGDKNGFYSNGTLVRGAISTTFRGDNKIDIFGIHQDSGHDNRRLIGRIYYIYFLENGRYVGKFIPVKRNSDGVLGMYDTIRNKFYTNNGSGEFVAGREIHYIDYIETDGNSYILTDAVFEHGVEITTSESFVVTGSRQLEGSSGNNPYYGINASNFFENSGVSSGCVVESNKVYKIIFRYEQNSTFLSVIDGGETIVSNLRHPSVVQTQNWCFFAINNSFGWRIKSGGRIYSSKMTKDGSLIRNFLPAKDFDGEGFLFDTITHKIYDNDGTGSIICGKDKRLFKQKILKTSPIDKISNEYVQYEKLKNEKGQYYDTAWCVDWNHDVEVKFGFSVSDLTTRKIILGDYDGSNATGGLSIEVAADGKLRLWTDGGKVDSKPFIPLPIDKRIDVKINYDSSNGIFKVKTLNSYYSYEFSISYKMSGTFPKTSMIFGDHRGGGDTAFEPFTLYYMMIKNGDVDSKYIPAKRISDNTYGLYDFNSKYLLVNSGDGVPTFSTEKIFGSKSAEYNIYPSYIKPVEYIVFHGKQYIDTGFKANTTKTRYVSEFDLETVESTETQALFGSRNNADIVNTTSANIFLTNNRLRLDWVGGGTSVSELSPLSNTRYKIDITRGNATLNDKTYTYTNSDSVDQLYNFYIGNISNGSPYPYESSDGFGGHKGRLYYSKIYNEDVLVRDFIPCYNLTLCEYGLWDKVTKKFYRNSGHGILSSKDEKYQCEVEYLESTGTQYIDTGVKYSVDSEYIFKIDCCYPSSVLNQGGLTNVGWNAGGFVCFHRNLGWSITGLEPYIYAPKDVLSTKTLTIQKGASSNTTLSIEGYDTTISRTHPNLTNRAMDYGFPLFAIRSSETLTPRVFIAGKTQIYVDDILVRSLITILDFNDTPCMYDTVTGKLFYNQGTGEFLHGERISKLPVGVTQVEYIESDGNSWIDTEIPATSDIGFDIDFLFGDNSSLSDFPTLVGAQLEDDSAFTSAYIYGDDFFMDAVGTTHSSLSISTPSIRSNSTINFVNDKKITFLNSDRSELADINGSPTAIEGANVFICAAGSPSGVMHPSAAKIYGAKITSRDRVVRDFTPVRVGEQGGLYDSITDKVFYSVGTQDFTYGKDVIGIPTAKSYVQDGLVAMWDGIENVGWGTHDPNATAWKDLSGNNHDMTFVGDVSFGEYYAAFELGTSYGNSPFNEEVTTEWTDEVVIVGTPSYTGATFNGICAIGTIGLQCCRDTSNVRYYPSSKVFNLGASDTLSVTVGNEIATIHRKAQYIREVELTSIPSASDSNGYTINRRENYTQYGLTNLRVANRRIYSRTLTAEEIAHNYEIDKIRFGL